MADAKSNYYESSLLDLILNGIDFPGGVADDGTLANLYIALHSSDPGEAKSQATNEISYGGYVRKAIARNATTPKWTVPATTAGTQQATLASAQDFVTATSPTTGSAVTATHFSVGVASTGAGAILYHGAISPNITIYTGVTPRLTTATYIEEQ